MTHTDNERASHARQHTKIRIMNLYPKGRRQLASWRTLCGVGGVLLLTLCPTEAAAGNRAARRQQAAARAAVVADSLAFEQARMEARRDYFYYAALQNNLATNRMLSTFELLKHAADIDSTSAPVLFSLAEWYERGGDKQNALRLTVHASRLDPNNLWYGLKEGSLLKKLQRPEEAIATYERLLRAHPDDMQVCEQLINLYGQTGNARQCLRILNHVEELEGTDLQLTIQKLYVYMQLEEPDSAYAAMQQLVDLHPYDVAYRIVQGDFLLQTGRIEDAKACYDAVSEMDKNNAMLYVSLANYYTAVGDEARADTMARAAMTHPQLDLDRKIDLLTDYLKHTLQTRLETLEPGAQRSELTSEEHEAAIDSLFAAVSAQHPTEPEPYELHAEYLVAVGQDSLAQQRFRDAVDLKPSEQRYWTAYLQAINAREDTVLLRRASKEAQEIHPDLLMTYIYLSQLDIAQGRNEEAQAEYRTALTQIPEGQKVQRSAIYGYIGDLYQHMAQMDSAYAYYDIALECYPENINVLNNYSYFLALEGKHLDRAERMMGTVIRLKPDEATYLDTYAWVYFKQGNYTLAKFYQKRAIDASDEESATLLEHYGDILSCSGDRKGALKYWKRAAELGKHTPTLDEKLRTGEYIEEPFQPGDL